MKPFIKWAGGKTQLLPDIRAKYPKELGKNINKYCEPFIGGGAVLFDILSNYELEEILINDINKELTNTYSQIKNNLVHLLDELSKMQELFWAMDTEARKLFYYEKRERFNHLKVNGDDEINFEKAALFIFLNKTCFNGLFRVNKKGLFNVPMGAYKMPVICDKDNLIEINKTLQNVKITTGDYKETLAFIDENTFVYIDPPYRPISETASFTSYAETNFDDNEQIALGQFVDRASEKGAKIIISNSDPKNHDADDHFFDDLYSEYEIARVSAKRMINCNANSRGDVKELLISNFTEIEDTTGMDKGENEMKYIETYKSMGILSDNAAFEYLMSNLKDTIRTYDFYVAWGKVLGNVHKIEVYLNILNTLIGKDDPEAVLRELIKDYPEVVPVIPFLIAERRKTIKIADIGGDIEYSFSKRKEYSGEEIDKIIYFVKECGLLKMLADKSIKNLVDYAIGVEVGLDSNARKNRSGDAMENLTEVYVKAICDKHGYQYIAQATASKIKQEFGKEVNTDKADRHFDFAVDTGDMLYLMEVNYYAGGGSKLKSVSGEFSSLFDLVKNDTTGFVWVTDGEGWLTAKRPLRETFDHTDYVMNINMIEQGLLEEIFVKGL
ncbi:MAG: DpnII family type II restriction endonuclease [Faecalibacterium sp.]